MPSALLIEDDPNNQAVIAVMLARCGFDVQTIGSMREASELTKRQFDIVVADIVLPDGSGEAAARAVGGAAGILLISGWPVSDLWDRGVVPPSILEGQYFLTKPFTFQEFRERLTQMSALSPRGAATPPDSARNAGAAERAPAQPPKTREKNFSCLH